MTKKNYFLIVSLLFLTLAVIHGYRIFAGWPVAINNHRVPEWVSGLAILITLTLSYYGLRLRKIRE